MRRGIVNYSEFFNEILKVYESVRRDRIHILFRFRKSSDGTRLKKGRILEYFLIDLGRP